MKQLILPKIHLKPFPEYFKHFFFLLHAMHEFFFTVEYFRKNINQNKLLNNQQISLLFKDFKECRCKKKCMGPLIKYEPVEQHR